MLATCGIGTCSRSNMRVSGRSNMRALSVVREERVLSVE